MLLHNLSPTNSRGESKPLEIVENFFLKFYHNIFKQFPGTLKAHLYRSRFIIAIKISRYTYNPCKNNENHNITFYWSAFKDLLVLCVFFQSRRSEKFILLKFIKRKGRNVYTKLFAMSLYFWVKNASATCMCLKGSKKIIEILFY